MRLQLFNVKSFAYVQLKSQFPHFLVRRAFPGTIGLRVISWIDLSTRKVLTSLSNWETSKAAIDFHPNAAVYMASLYMEMTMLEREVRKTHARLAR